MLWLIPGSVHAITFRELLQDTPKPKEITYKQVGADSINLYVFAPDDLKSCDKRAALVWIHGGAWVGGNADVFFLHAHYSASRGAVGVSINYRLLAPRGSAINDFLMDCKSAIRYLRSHAAQLDIDPQKIVVLGDSAGGHLAAALGTVEGFDDSADDLSVSAKPNAVVLYNPIVDMTDAAWVKFVIAGAALEKSPPPGALVPMPAHLELARQLSPLFAVGPNQPPTLLMHGLADTVVVPEQARRFEAAMKQAGNRCDLVLLDGARHAFVIAGYTASEERVVNTIRTIDAFLASLGLLSGQPTLQVGQEPAWPERKTGGTPSTRPATRAASLPKAVQ
jgi:acetyl esterase/lipase